VSAKGSVAARDPETGQLRDATPEELLELQQQSAAAAEVPEPIVSATGFSGLRLGADQMTFTVATRQADGTVGVEHAAGKKEAERLVHAAEKSGPVAGKERLLDR
jgi:hydroxylamine reductase (hybrid-cluster protein)